MNPKPEPSPLSLRPPQRVLLSKPPLTHTDGIRPFISKPEPITDPIEVTARYTMPSARRPPIVQYLGTLNQFLGTRLKGPAQSKVIAVDGLDGNAVRMMIDNLDQHVSKVLGYSVRIVNERPIRAPIDHSAQLPYYVRQIQEWDLMSELIAEAPPPAPSRARAGPCVYLLPLSPLMATVRASNYLALTGTYGTEDLWCWLASHWGGHPRPDITINIEDTAHVSVNREILRLQGSNMNTLIITKGLDGGVDLVPQQLRRVCFEVEDWLVSED